LSAVVVDASVGLKWFLHEVHSVEARQWRTYGELCVPAFFFDLEIASILWKKIRRGEINRTEADEILVQLPSLPVTRVTEGPLLSATFELAATSQRTVYDCLYLAAAMSVNGFMLTADQRLFNSLQGTKWASRIEWVANSPPPVT